MNTEQRISEIADHRLALKAMSVAAHRLANNTAAVIYAAEASRAIDAVGGKEQAIAFLLGQGAEDGVIMAVQSL